MASRLDIGELRPARMDGGRLVADAHITRAGVFTYMNADGTLRRELRDDSEVFAPDSMASARMLPMTNRHPGEGAVTPANARKHMVGSTGERVERDDDHLRTSVMVADGDAMRDLANGINQVSCGYKCDVVDKAGVHPKYGRYDVSQTNIRYNHLAIVPAARAGATARIRMDAADLPTEDLWMRVDAKDEKDPEDMEEDMSSGELDDDDEADDDAGEDDDEDEKVERKDWASHYASMASPGAASKMDHADMTITQGAYRKDDAAADDDADDDGDDDKDGPDPDDEGKPLMRGGLFVSRNPGAKKKKKKNPFVKNDWADRYADLAVGKKVPGPDKSSATPEKRSSRSDVATRPVEQGSARMDEKLKKELDAALAELAVQKSRADSAEQRLGKETERADAAVGEVKGLKRDLDQAKTRLDEAASIDVAAKDDKIVELTERIDAAEKVIAEFPDRLASGVKARTELEKAALGVLGSKFVVDGLSDREIMVAVVEKRGGSITNESDAELRGEFRAAVRGDAAWKESAAKVAATQQHNRQAEEVRQDAAPSPMAKTRDAWKQPLPGARKGA